MVQRDISFYTHFSSLSLANFLLQGGLFAIYDDEQEEGKEGGREGRKEEWIKIESLPLVDFPEGVAFHPHGMYYHQ